MKKKRSKLVVGASLVGALFVSDYAAAMMMGGGMMSGMGGGSSNTGTSGSTGMGGMMGMMGGTIPPSLQGQAIPPVAGLTDGTAPIVVDKNAAIALGKALFWDSNVGSDGMACASCHFHAGADSRVKNQLNSGQNSTEATGKTFEKTASGLTGGANYTLNKSDFPLHQFNNPFDNQSGFVFKTDDVVGSAGTFGGTFTSVLKTGSSNDTCSRTVDPVFHVNATGTRRVTARNAPSVINAVFNVRNFWDGRADNIFNGSSSTGAADTTAGVWIKQTNGTVVKQKLNLVNSSLASQALAPPLNDTEMGCNQRLFSDLGRKLLSRSPLEKQTVHNQDSVLGALTRSTGKGLNTTYAAMVQKAFNPNYWSVTKTGQFGKPTTNTQAAYTQTEANFSMFFGLAIQLYESTLVSDQALFDTLPRDNNSVPTAFSDSEKRGLNIFVQDGCVSCHSGAAFTAATVGGAKTMMMGMPADFTNTGVSNPVSDSGLSGKFKTPTLRNIELTGPYMHNGDMATLEQVIEFYSRKGNFSNTGLQSMMASMMFNFSNLATDVQARADLVAFLKTLTDDRVRYEKAPFDHPELAIPNGHTGNELAVVAGNTLAPKILAKDEFLTLPAVGKDGNVAPILPFESILSK